MGFVTNLPYEFVRPTQNKLDRYRLREVAELYMFGKEGSRLPVPVKLTDVGYLILDGHHRATVSYLLNDSLEAFVVSSERDLFKLKDFRRVKPDDIFRNNFNITYRFLEACDSFMKMQKLGILGIPNLLRRLSVNFIYDILKN
jgi:hypothetical protein